MNKDKWMLIFNSFSRLQFYAFLETQRPEAIADLDKHFQDFVDSYGYNPDKKDTVHFFGGDTLIGFCYLILVRTFEYIDKDLNDLEKSEVLKIDNWNIFNISTYNDFILKYSISVTKLSEKKNNGDNYYSNDNEKLTYFIYRLRNSISHHHYLNPDMDSIKLIDKKPKSEIIEMECIFKYSNFLNFCMDYFRVVNTKLQSLNHF